MTTSSALLGALVAAAVAVIAAPQLARLTRTVPDDDEPRWWYPTVGGPVGRTRLVATGATAVVLGGLAGSAAGFGAALPALAVSALGCAALTVIDHEHHRLPDRLTVTTALLTTALLAGASAIRADWWPLARAAIAGAVVYAVLRVLAFAARGQFGAGDVKLGAVLGGVLGWFSWTAVPVGLFAGFVVGALASTALVITGRATMRSAIAFGPMLVTGSYLMIGLHVVP